MMREAEFDAWLKNDYAGRNGVGLGEREGADLLEGRHLRQPAFLLLRRAEHVDRTHGQARVHAVEGAHAAVAA